MGQPKPIIALIRGINVGGKNKLAMRQLVELLEGLGLLAVRTYIQSGNVVFLTHYSDLSELSSQIQGSILEHAGFAPLVLLLRLADLEFAMAGNPFPNAVSEPKTLHLYFLADYPDEPDMSQLEAIRRGSERYLLSGKVFYLHAPEGIGRSKLAAKAERVLGVPATARNWRTVAKILTLAQEIAS